MAGDPSFVPWHIYERDMTRINETLDKLIIISQNQAVAAAEHAGEEQLKDEQKANRWKVGLIALAAALSIIGNFVVNLLNSVN